jgi:PIN domain nuclease of toxin-antitoxin system
MSEGRSLVLDASALLAYLFGETGAEAVRDALAVGCRMSAVNWSEVLSKVAGLEDSPRELVAKLEDSQLLGTSLHIEPFGDSDALVVGELRPRTRDFGLSLGDRACLALSLRLGGAVLTADRQWQHLADDLGLEVLLIR